MVDAEHFRPLLTNDAILSVIIISLVTSIIFALDSYTKIVIDSYTKLASTVIDLLNIALSNVSVSSS